MLRRATQTTESGATEHFAFGVAAMQGWRSSMEDAHLLDMQTADPPLQAIIGVFDGHGGALVSKFAAVHFSETLRAALAHGSPVELAPTAPAELQALPRDVRALVLSLRNTFVSLDQLLEHEASLPELQRLEEESRANLAPPAADEAAAPQTSAGAALRLNNLNLVLDSFAELQPKVRGPATHVGSTAVVVSVLRGADGGFYLVTANAGDSRAVLARCGSALPLSRDHKPDGGAEHRRILSAGGTVSAGRVDGCLNLSRSVGDLFYKDPQLPPEQHKISCVPEVSVLPLSKGDEFVVVACDGIWDVMSNQDVVNFVHSSYAALAAEAKAAARDGAKGDEGEGQSAKRDDAEGEGHGQGAKRDDAEGEDQGYGAEDEPAMLTAVATRLCDECVSSSPIETAGLGCDNMSVIIFKLRPAFLAALPDEPPAPLAFFDLIP